MLKMRGEGELAGLQKIMCNQPIIAAFCNNFYSKFSKKLFCFNFGIWCFWTFAIWDGGTIRYNVTQLDISRHATSMLQENKMRFRAMVSVLVDLLYLLVISKRYFWIAVLWCQLGQDSLVSQWSAFIICLKFCYAWYSCHILRDTLGWLF